MGKLLPKGVQRGTNEPPAVMWLFQVNLIFMSPPREWISVPLVLCSMFITVSKCLFTVTAASSIKKLNLK